MAGREEYRAAIEALGEIERLVRKAREVIATSTPSQRVGAEITEAEWPDIRRTLVVLAFRGICRHAGRIASAAAEEAKWVVDESAGRPDPTPWEEV